MRALVTGASGFIGGRFLRELPGWDVRGLCFSHTRPGLLTLDLGDRGAVRECCRCLRPDVVIHCAARPSVDWCEAHPDEARVLNRDAVGALAEECGAQGALLVLLSTDYVFDGEAGPYAEEDGVRPVNVYGRLKLEAEEAVRARCDRHLIVRTTNVYGYDPASRNFLMTLLPRLARGERVPVAADQVGSPTHVGDLCRAVRDLAEGDREGTIHVAGPEVASRLDWARAAAEAFGLDAGLVDPARTADLGQAAQRPLRSGLRTERLARLLAWRPLGVGEGLAAMRAEWGGAPPIAEW